ncbi:hypothetical protein Peur_011259 [Populus x canadensis]
MWQRLEIYEHRKFVVHDILDYREGRSHVKVSLESTNHTTVRNGHLFYCKHVQHPYLLPLLSGFIIIIIENACFEGGLMAAVRCRLGRVYVLQF